MERNLNYDIYFIPALEESSAAVKNYKACVGSLAEVMEQPKRKEDIAMMFNVTYDIMKIFNE